MNNKGIEVTGPVTLMLDPQDLNVVLKGLEELPTKLGRIAFNKIEKAIVEQYGPQRPEFEPPADKRPALQG